MVKAKHNPQVGDRFGELTVTEIGLRLKPTRTQVARQQVGERGVLCKCDCGGERLVRIISLVSQRATSCGCRSRRLREQRGSASDDAPRPCGGRQPASIDTVKFQPVIDEFLRAAAVDADYTVAICAAAVRIRSKRAQWEARLALRAAEKAAREACAASALTSCEVQNPCGTGACPMGSPEFAHIDAPAIAPTVHKAAARRTRPQPRTGPGGEYTIESALPLVLAQRQAV